MQLWAILPANVRVLVCDVVIIACAGRRWGALETVLHAELEQCPTHLAACLKAASSGTGAA